MTGRINEIDAWKSRVDGSKKGDLASGPDGGKGTIIGDKSLPSSDFGYFPDRQTWRQEGQLWVGMFTDRVPDPSLLQRQTMLEGHAVTLVDGQQWTVPLVYASPSYAEWEINLPRLFDVDDKGQWCYGEVRPEFAKLFDGATRFYNAWMQHVISQAELLQGNDGAAEVEFNLSLLDELEIVSLAMGTNYRVSSVELAMLRLLDKHCVTSILLAMIDWPKVEDRLNKKKR
jgi:hypothetical protein